MAIVPSSVHLPHPARAERSRNHIRPEQCACGKRHKRRDYNPERVRPLYSSRADDEQTFHNRIGEELPTARPETPCATAPLRPWRIMPHVSIHIFLQGIGMPGAAG